MFTVQSLHFSRGSARPGYGLRVTVRAQEADDGAGPWPRRLRGVRIDAAGGALECAPARIRLAMQLTMPHAVRRIEGLGGRTELPRQSLPGERAQFELSFILGAKNLPDAVVDSALAQLQQDTPFLVELLCESGGGEEDEQRAGGILLARAATTAGLIRASLATDGAPSALAPGTPALLELAARRDRWRALSSRWLGKIWLGWLWVRWWALPLVFTTLCWALVLPPWAQQLRALARARGRGLLHAAPHGGSSGVPGRSNGDSSSGALRGSTLAHVLPPVPTSLRAAFELGQLAERLAGVDVPAQQERLLVAAAALVGRGPSGAETGAPVRLSATELSAVGARLAELEAHIGIVARVRGAFSFINLCWLLAICGLALSVWPTLWHVLSPFRRWLVRCSRWLVREVLEPLAERAHRWGLLEALSWGSAAALVADGATVFSRESGLYVALCGVALAIGPCHAYSALSASWIRRGPLAMPLSYADRESLTRLLSGWLCASLAPLAVHFESKLLGYVAVFAAYSVLGFSVACHGLCWVVGFSSQRAMERVAATSALLLATFVGARELGVGWLGVPPAQAQQLAAPFASAVAVVGALALHLALLITSSRYYSTPSNASRWHWYARHNALAAGVIALGVLCGTLGGSAGLANTSTVFGVIWLVEKYAELHLESGWHGWTLIFVLSLGLYRASLWLHDHPQFVASLFEP
mmetsp:Transcript_3588/g.10173  ORF Transcript_3588/g.10173 Transcript_3588/m.10173 type:complete len:701 (+) Transcript_3588:108-2210(+)